MAARRIDPATSAFHHGDTMDHTIWAMQARAADLRVRVSLNGYPVFMPPDTGGRTIGMNLNPWIVEGSNTVDVRLGRTEDGAELSPTARFDLYVYRTYKQQPAGEEVPIAQFVWSMQHVELESDGMTDVYRSEFDVPSDQAFGRWAWQDAVPFDPGDRVAVELLVGKCRQAMVQRDADAFLTLVRLKLDEMARALGMDPSRADQMIREQLQPYFDSDDLVVDPIDYGVVSLIPTAEGRIVLVMGPMGAPVLRGRLPATKPEEPPPDPLLWELAVSNLGGTWTVVR